MGPKIIAVIIGVIGALLGVYLKEFIQFQMKRRRAIVILRSNLYLFLEKIQENEQLSKVFMAGSILDDRYIESLKSGDDSKYQELLNQIDNLAEAAKTKNVLTDSNIEKACEKIRSLSSKEMDIVFEEIDRIREDIEHGTFVIGNEELKLLDRYLVHRVLQVKRSINDIYLTIKIILMGVYEREDIDSDYLRTLFFQALKESILACRHVMPLIKMCDKKI